MIKLNIDNSFTASLPKDEEPENYVRTVSDFAYCRAIPLSFPKSQLVHTSTQLLKELELDPYADEESFKKLVKGQFIYPDTEPYAMGYAGHQFGNWAGQLGDGRAINLFESIHNKKRWTWQLKGAGPTPFSRRGDGLAVLRSSIREHLCSEAMYHLGVPTTRSLALSITGEEVLRDVMYDGNPAHEKGAVVCRLSPSFVRFGNFEWFASQGNTGLLKQLTDYVINHFYDHITSHGTQRYLDFFQEVSTRTLNMIIHWQRVGFVHGVMNTDNMSILGLTIDYGPYGWLEPYDHGWTPNTTDREHKRYRYGAQPEIGLWNLLQLANALFELINDAPALEAILNQYKTDYQNKHLTVMRGKLGLLTVQDNDQNLVSNLIEVLHLHEVDMTIFFRELHKIDDNNITEKALENLSIAFYDYESLSEAHRLRWTDWLEIYIKRIAVDRNAVEDDSAFAKARSQQLNSSNPKYVLRNYMAQLAIESAEKGDYNLIHELYTLLQRPYDEQPEFEKWYAKRPEWARSKIGCSMLSCSS